MSGADDRRTVAAGVGLVAVLAAVGWAGEIRLRVSPAQEVRTVQALERESAATYRLTPGAGETPGEALFRAEGLPQGLYDLVLLTRRGRIEGVNLRVRGVPAEAPALSERDRSEIRRLISGMTSFADRRRILFLRGRGTEARALVEELTTRKTTLRSAAPFVVWRVEVWYYRKEFGAWDRYDWSTIVRERPSLSDFENTTWVFEPALGGLEVGEESPVVEVTYRVPERPSAGAERPGKSRVTESPRSGPPQAPSTRGSQE